MDILVFAALALLAEPPCHVYERHSRMMTEYACPTGTCLRESMTAPLAYTTVWRNGVCITPDPNVGQVVMWEEAA